MEKNVFYLRKGYVESQNFNSSFLLTSREAKDESERSEQTARSGGAVNPPVRVLGGKAPWTFFSLFTRLHWFKM